MITALSMLSLQGFAILFVVMTIVWLIQLKTKNAGIVDAVWAFSFPILASFYILRTAQYGPRQLALLVLVVLWGFRLGIHLFQRNHKGAEDARYAQLRKEWGAKANLKMFLFFQVQALLATILSAPYALVSVDETTDLSVLNYLGLGIGLIALVGESVADRQLRVFKQSPSNKGKILNTGLWGRSRHPNYFFEWLMWVAFLVYALSSPSGWIAIIGVWLMYHFLMNVTGIPATEEQMLKSRGEPFKRYQEETPAFFPRLSKSRS